MRERCGRGEAAMGLGVRARRRLCRAVDVEYRVGPGAR